MKHAWFCFALLLISNQAHAQKVAARWFPLEVGNKWIYERETRDDIGEGRSHLETHSWQTEETITGAWTIPEGRLIERTVRVTDGVPPLGWRVNSNSAYLVRGDCLYGADSGEIAWDPMTHQLTSGFRKELRAGRISPDFCFPFVVHKTWGAPNTLPNRDWEVAGNGRDPATPDKQRKFHVTSISSYPGSGATVDIWFERGVGIVREEEIHHGTTGEKRVRLLRFEPAPKH